MILLDTNTVIALFNGNKEVLKRIQAGIDRISLSTLASAELDYGAKASQQAKENTEKLHRFVLQQLLYPTTLFLLRGMQSILKIKKI